MNLTDDDILQLNDANKDQLIDLLSAAKYVRDIWRLHLSSSMEDCDTAEEHEFNCHLMLDKVVSNLLGEEQALPNLEVSEFDE